ncbi:hypothetical protein ACEQUB_p00250 (plasmid) [Ralstonia syzygii]
MADASILHIRPLTAGFGAEIEGVDTGADMTSDTVRAIRAAWLRFGVLVFGSQTLDPARQVAFTRRFGEPLVYTRSENACAGHPEVLVLSNVVVDGKPIGAAISSRYWHTDGHFLQCPPAGTLLYGKDVPPEGATRASSTWQPRIARCLCDCARRSTAARF